eukprot:2305362-Pleurochrysis_carterae.AAC.2
MARVSLLVPQRLCAAAGGAPSGARLSRWIGCVLAAGSSSLGVDGMSGASRCAVGLGVGRSGGASGSAARPAWCALLGGGPVPLRCRGVGSFTAPATCGLTRAAARNSSACPARRWSVPPSTPSMRRSDAAESSSCSGSRRTCTLCRAAENHSSKPGSELSGSKAGTAKGGIAMAGCSDLR